MAPRMYFEDSPDGPRLVVRRSNTTGHRHSHHERKRHHHLADDVVDHMKDRVPRLHRPWHHQHYSEDENIVHHHRHTHRRKSAITWEEWNSLVDREKAFRKQADQLQQDVEVIKGQLESQKASSAALARDNAALSATICKFQDANRQFARENEAFRNQLGDAQGHDQSHHRELRSLQREVDILKAERVGLMDRIAQMSEDLKHGCTSRVGKLLAEIGAAKKGWRDAVDEKEQWRARYERQVSSQNGLRDRIHDMQCHIERLQEEVNKSRRYYTTTY